MGEDEREEPAVEALRAEVMHWQGEAARADARAAEAFAESEALREQLRVAIEASVRASEDVKSLQAKLTAAGERERTGVARYRELVLQAEPSLPADLVAGDSIDAIEQSRAAAREVVGRVRAQIEEQAQGARVPAGAPVRSAPDVSSMTPEEKIRYGLSRRA